MQINQSPSRGMSLANSSLKSACAAPQNKLNNYHKIYYLLKGLKQWMSVVKKKKYETSLNTNMFLQQILGSSKKAKEEKKRRKRKLAFDD